MDSNRRSQQASGLLRAEGASPKPTSVPPKAGRGSPSSPTRDFEAPSDGGLFLCGDSAWTRTVGRNRPVYVARELSSWCTRRENFGATKRLKSSHATDTDRESSQFTYTRMQKFSLHMQRTLESSRSACTGRKSSQITYAHHLKVLAARPQATAHFFRLPQSMRTLHDSPARRAGSSRHSVWNPILNPSNTRPHSSKS